MPFMSQIDIVAKNWQLFEIIKPNALLLLIINILVHLEKTFTVEYDTLKSNLAFSFHFFIFTFIFHQPMLNTIFSTNAKYLPF